MTFNIKMEMQEARAIPSQREGAGRGFANYLTPTSSFPREGIAQPHTLNFGCI